MQRFVHVETRRVTPTAATCEKNALSKQRIFSTCRRLKNQRLNLDPRQPARASSNALVRLTKLAGSSSAPPSASMAWSNSR